MKKLILFVLGTSVLAACATSGTTGNTAANMVTNPPITFEQALQKSAETRQKVLDAKKQYEQAQTAAAVANGQKDIGDALKETVQQQLDTAKGQLKQERDAWKEVLK
jgi:hypothetical protein